MPEEEYWITEYVPEASWCPECGGPPRDDHASVMYCATHQPYTTGTADLDADFPVISAWLVDAGGEVNQKMCAFIHRKES